MSHHHHGHQGHGGHGGAGSASTNSSSQLSIHNLKRNKIIHDKFDRKYNLISFILLRKNDNYLTDDKYYLNDQAIYQQVDELIEQHDLASLSKIFKSSYQLFKYQQGQRQLQQIRLTSENYPPQLQLLAEDYSGDTLSSSVRTSCSSASRKVNNTSSSTKSTFKDLDSLNEDLSGGDDDDDDESKAAMHVVDRFRCTNFTNSYNCNLFVYTIRQCLEHKAKEAELQAAAGSSSNSVDEDEDEDEEEEEDFYSNLIELLFMKQCRPSSYFLVDGDFPRRNVMHYASRHNCDLIPRLIISSCNEQLTSSEDLSSEPPVDEEQILNACATQCCHGDDHERKEEETDDDEDDDEETECDSDSDTTENYADADDSSEDTENEELDKASSSSAETDTAATSPAAANDSHQVVPNASASRQAGQEADQEEAKPDDEDDYLAKTKSYFVPKSKFTQSEFILFRLCMQTDYNGNTPIHIAAMNNAFDVLKYINPLYIRNAQLMYNEDGLNPFLLACRHSSLLFLKLMVEKCSNSKNLAFGYVDGTLLASRDKLHGKNCLHYVCARGCGQEARDICLYLINIANQYDRCQASSPQVAASSDRTFLKELIGNVSLLTGSVYHAAASNLTRLSTLWYLLTLYPNEGIYTSYMPNQSIPPSANHIRNLSILNSLDFREFSVIDCLMDSVMNLREMAPPDCVSLANFYHQLVVQQQAKTTARRRSAQRISFTNRYGLLDIKGPPKSKAQQQQLEEASVVVTEQPPNDFDNLLNKCLYKLLIDCQSSIYNLPRVKNKWQLLEVCKILVFMSKFGGFRTYSNDLAGGKETTQSEAQTKQTAADENNKNSESSSCKSIQSYFMNDFVINAPRFESIHCKNFEAFCLNFLNTFIFFGDLLPPFAANSSSSSSGGSSGSMSKGSIPSHTPAVNKPNNLGPVPAVAMATTTPVMQQNGGARLGANQAKLSTSCEPSRKAAQSEPSPAPPPPPPQQQQHPEINQADLYVLVEILKNLHELCYIVLNSGNFCYSLKFQQKIYSFLKSYLSVLVNYLSRLENTTTTSHNSNSNSSQSHQNSSSANLRAIVKTNNHHQAAFALSSSVSSPLLTTTVNRLNSHSNGYDTESSSDSTNEPTSNNDTNDNTNSAATGVRFTLYSRLPSHQPVEHQQQHSSNDQESEVENNSQHRPEDHSPVVKLLSQEEDELLKSFKSSIQLYQAKCERLNQAKEPNSLKNLCRIAVNKLIVCKRRPEITIDFKKPLDLEEASDWSLSAFSPNYRYFRLPKAYHKLVNFLTFDLIHDLYGPSHDMLRLMAGGNH